MVSHQGHCWSLMIPWFSALFRPLNSGARDDQGILAKSGTEDRQKTKKKWGKKEAKRPSGNMCDDRAGGQGTLPISDPVPDWHLRRGRGEPLGRKVQPIIQSNQNIPTQNMISMQAVDWTIRETRRVSLHFGYQRSSHPRALGQAQLSGSRVTHSLPHQWCSKRVQNYGPFFLGPSGTRGNSLKSDFKSCIIITSASH